jgi:nucleoside-diphosphate-sugar epimerase
MRLLLTGTSGYLGRHVLDLVLADDRVEEVLVTSRTKRSHPHSKVRVINVDLSTPADPGFLGQLGEDFDAVVHLAGLYDFQESYGNCYTNNVLPTQHLVQKLKAMNRKRRVPLFFASTYAVNFGQGLHGSESPLELLPTRRIPYAFTKAVAERLVTDSGIPATIFRLGIITGRTADGVVEKADGAYTFVNWLNAVSAHPLFRRLPAALRQVPLPGDPDGLLPLLPVDVAARIFHEALFLQSETAALAPTAQIYGVYNEQSVRIRDFCDHLLAEFAPGARGIYVKRIPDALLRAAPFLINVSPDALRFALHPIPLKNPAFQAAFGADSIPHFEQYRARFMSGYRKYRQNRIEVV